MGHRQFQNWPEEASWLHEFWSAQLWLKKDGLPTPKTVNKGPILTHLLLLIIRSGVCPKAHLQGRSRKKGKPRW